MDKVEEKMLGILREEVLKHEGEDVQILTLKESRELIRLAKEHTCWLLPKRIIITLKQKI